MRRSLYLIIYIMAWAACTDDHAEPVPAEDGAIRLGASVVGMESSTRAVTVPAIYKGSNPSADNPFKADVWFSNTSGEFLHSPALPTNLPCHTQMTFEGALVYAYTPTEGSSVAENLKYSTDGDLVYCVGFHPQDRWIPSTDGKTATATIDGKTDLMFAPQISGSWSSPLKEHSYKHLLTWLKVCICTTTQEAAAAWGDVESISIRSADGLSVDLGTGAVTYATTTSPFVVVENQPLHTTMQEVGSALCSPAKEYTLTVKTANVEERTITIPVKWLDDNETNVTDGDVTSGKVAGRLFILSLYFNEYAVVEGVCTLNAWNNQDEDLYLQ